MNGLQRRHLTAQALVYFSKARDEGGCGFDAETSDAAARIYGSLLEDIDRAERIIGDTPPIPEDIRAAVCTGMQNTLQVAILTQLNLAISRKVAAQQEEIEAQRKVLGGLVDQQTLLIKTIGELGSAIEAVRGLAHRAIEVAGVASPLTDDDTRH